MRQKLSFVLFSLLLPTSTYAADRLAPPLSELSKRAGHNKGEAVILLQNRKIRLDSDGNTHKTLYRAIKLNTRDAARDFSQISIGFNSHFTQAQLDFARVLTSDGKILELGKDAVQIQNNASADFYHDGRDLVFSLPAVAQGSVIEYQIEFKPIKAKIKGLASGGHMFHAPEGSQSEKGYRVDRVLESKLIIEHPSGKALNFSVLEKSAKYKKTTSGGITQHQWRYTRLPSVPVEQSMPSLLDILPYLQYSTAHNWSSIDSWAFKLFDNKITPGSDIKKVASKIAQKYSSRDEKIKAVYEHVQKNIRYVFAHVGRGGFEPHAAPDVLANQYGDCKDQTILMISLLRELGIEAYPALISTDNSIDANPELPGLPFDHMITFLPATSENEALWIDTTGEQSLFPGFTRMIEGRKALVVNGKGGEIHTTPVLGLEENLANVDIHFSPLENNQANGEVKFSFNGLYEDYFRSWWINTNDKKALLGRLIRDLYPEAKLKSYSTTSTLDLATPFAVNTQFSIERGVSEDGKISYAASPAQLIKMFTGLFELPEAEGRVHDYILPKGLHLKLNMSIEAPEQGATPVLLNSGLDRKNEWFELTQSGHDEGGKYFVNIDFKLPASQLSNNEYRDFSNYIERLKKERPWLVLYNTSMTPNKQVAATTQVTPAINKGSSTDLLDHIQSELDEGEYESALRKAEEYVKVNPSSGEGFYLLGLAQGYLDKFSASDRSFAKAKSLGYKF